MQILSLNQYSVRNDAKIKSKLNITSIGLLLRKKALLIAFLIAIMVGGSALVSTVHFCLAQSDNSQITSAVNYLVRNYNGTIGLIHESPDSTSFSNTYWLYSDNFLAQLALSNFTSSNATISEIYSNISSTVSYWSKTQPNLSNQYQVLNNPSVFPFNAAQNFVIAFSHGATIKSTVNNQTGTLAPQNYADIAFLEAIAYHDKGDDAKAQTVYNEATWDGSGFKDSVYNGAYATYKTALYILASKVLGYSYNPDAKANLLNCQLTNGVDEGGFATSYTGNGIPASGSNTETTSLAILALTYTSPTPSPTPVPTAEFPSLLLILTVIMAVSLSIAVLVSVRKSKILKSSNRAREK